MLRYLGNEDWHPFFRQVCYFWVLLQTSLHIPSGLSDVSGLLTEVSIGKRLPLKCLLPFADQAVDYLAELFIHSSYLKNVLRLFHHAFRGNGKG